MDDFKPFCLADNMARSANLGEFLDHEGGKATRGRSRMKKPGRVCATGSVLQARWPCQAGVSRNYFALATTDSNGL